MWSIGEVKSRMINGNSLLIISHWFLISNKTHHFYFFSHHQLLASSFSPMRWNLEERKNCLEAIFWVVFHYHARHHYADHYLIKPFTSLPVFFYVILFFSSHNFHHHCTSSKRRRNEDDLKIASFHSIRRKLLSLLWMNDFKLLLLFFFCNSISQ